MATLEYDYDGSHNTFELKEKCTNIGRGAENELQLVRDSELSRRHCSILRLEDGRCLLRDDASRNGTFINEQKIDPASPIPLQDGDEVHIGNSYFTFHL